MVSSSFTAWHVSMHKCLIKHDFTCTCVCFLLARVDLLLISLWQGIQCVVDDSGGFSGVAAAFLENIADEYPNVPVLLYNARNPSLNMDSKGRKQAISRNLHDAVSFSRLSELCKLIIPVGLPSLSGSKNCYSHNEILSIKLPKFLKYGCLEHPRLLYWTKFIFF